MAKTLSTLRSDVQKIIKDDDKVLQIADVQYAIERASRILSRRSPCVKTTDKTGDGTTFKWAVPSDWITDFSTLLSVLYPFDETDEVPANEMERDEYDIIKTNAGVYYFRLNYAKPSSSEKVRFSYTTLHTVSETASACTITSAIDEDSVIFYAASLCLMTMSVRAISTGYVSLGADTVNYQNRSGAYKALAKTYSEMSGLDKYAQAEDAVGCSFVELDSPDRIVDLRIDYVS
jgi:hypothetical protein